MLLTVAPNQSAIQKALGDFLLAILPPGFKVVVGQVNRVPEPADVNFAVMWPLRRGRLSTNIDDFVDTLFTGSIAADVLTVIAVEYGTIDVNRLLFGADVAPGTTITEFLTGEGGTGTYKVSVAQSLTSRTLAAGVTNIMQPTEVVMQVDVHGPAADDNAQIISTILRDPLGVELFALSGPSITPLYADDPLQMPFTNAEQQYEDRYVVDIHLQADQVITVPQQGAGAITVDLKNVDASYPE